MTLAALVVAHLYFSDHKKSGRDGGGKKEREADDFFDSGDPSHPKKRRWAKKMSQKRAGRKDFLADPWVRNRRAIAEATHREREDMENLEEISDSQANYRISKKYKGIHISNFSKNTPFIAKIGAYYIVEAPKGDVDMVYHGKTGRMGVMNGSIMVNVNPDGEVKRLLEQWEQSERIEVGSLFLHIGVVELKIHPGENIAEIAKKLGNKREIDQVKIVVIGDDIRPW